MEERFFHPAYLEKTKELNNILPYQDEIISCYAEYEGKLKKPDLLGKTVRVTERQFPQIYMVVSDLSQEAQIDPPKIYVYEDFYYGMEAKGAGSPRIEIAAKTIDDFSPMAIKFLLAREICRIKYGIVKLSRVAEQALQMLSKTSLVPGTEAMVQGLKITYANWSRTSHYTADCYGYLTVLDVNICIKTILALVLNNLTLVKQVNVCDYLAQAKDIYLLNDTVSRYSQNDEKIPYGPLRIRNLLAFASAYAYAAD